VDLYSQEQKQIFQFHPGITDVSSLFFWNESDLLSQQDQPEDFYITTILPQKINKSLTYQKSANFLSDLGIIFKTIKSFIFR
jgi:lipopolysaccharide/colanic/teichoic acid biosynthesis glycosyltransferase